MAKQVLVSRVIRRMHKRKEKFKRKKKTKTFEHEVKFGTTMAKQL
jgi:hypothetical protein